MLTTLGPILQLKVQLLGVKPPVWRRLLAPASLGLADLHRLIQDGMGWTDTHLHEFEVAGRRYGAKHPDDDSMFDEELQDEDRFAIGQFFSDLKDSIAYSYDFGDGWRHKITLEKRWEAERGVKYPRCTGGKRACPPEDCGGPWGYEDLRAAIADPEHENHEDMMAWVPPGFDPERFSVADVNEILSGQEWD